MELACIISTKLLGHKQAQSGWREFFLVSVWCVSPRVFKNDILELWIWQICLISSQWILISHVECSQVGGGCLRFFRSKQVSNSVCTIKWFLYLIITKRLYHNSSLNSNPYSIRQREWDENCSNVDMSKKKAKATLAELAPVARSNQDMMSRNLAFALFYVSVGSLMFFFFSVFTSCQQFSSTLPPDH